MRYFLLYMIFLKSLLLNGQMSESVVWPSSQPGDSISEYFVYGLAVTKKGKVLAFSEARIKPGDATPHHIAMKRSVDGGRSWLLSQNIVESKNGACYANPTPIVDTRTGNVFLFYAQNYENEASDLYCIVSNDEGQTWSAPRKLTSLFSDDPFRRALHLPGPGHGIALKNGRLLLQVWHRHSIQLPSDKRMYGVSTVYSDDHGKTWQAGGYVPMNDSLQGNESRIVELLDGKIVMNARPGNSTLPRKRIISVSTDRGISWSSFTESTQAAFTTVDAGLNKISKKDNTYLLSTYPSGPGRNNMVISLSHDNGTTWTGGIRLSDGIANYSDVVVLKDNTILVLYGKGKPKEVVATRINWNQMGKQP